MRSTSSLTSLLATAALLSTAAFAQVQAPVLGYLPDRGHLWPVNGIPASASIAPALDFGGSAFIQMAVSPRQDFALVSAADSGAVLLAYPGGNTVAIAGTSAYPASVALSPLGSAAVLWFASSRELEILSGLPSAPVVRKFDASFLSGTSSDVPSALAVSDDGAWGAGAWPAGVWAFGPNGEARSMPIASLSRPSRDRAFALAFFAGRQDLAVATRTGVYSVTDVGGSAALSTLYTAPSLQMPSGLALSTDNQKLVMTDARGSILTITPSTGAATTIECGCTPEGVFPLGGQVFRITGLTGSIFRIFDAGSSSVFLVPLSPGVPGSGFTGGSR